MLDQILHVEWLVACGASDAVCVKHFEDECRWGAVPTVDLLADFTLFLVLLQVLVIHLHVEAVAAVELPTLLVVALYWRVHDF